MGERQYSSTIFTSAVDGGEWSASRPGRFTPEERDPGTHWKGCWVVPRAGLDDVENRKLLILPGLELRPLGRPTRSQSLYRLRFPGSHSLSVRSIQFSIQLHKYIEVCEKWYIRSLERYTFLIHCPTYMVIRNVVRP
jgi:hypothetical protein